MATRNKVSSLNTQLETMSDERGDDTNNGPVISSDDVQQEVQCPDVDFSPYDEHGRLKPNVVICQPILPPPTEQSDSNSNNEPSNEPEQPKNETKQVETKEETTVETKEETKTEQSNSEIKPAENSNGETKKSEQSNGETKKSEQPKEESKEPELSPDELKALNKSFSEQFKLFSKFGDTKSDGKLLSLSQSDKWMKQAKVIDKHITTTDTGIHFKKLKSLKVSESDYKKFLEDLAKTKKVSCIQLKNKMISCGPPGLSSQVAGTKAPSAFERLTDTSKYTGSHKQRFDESGKGRGIAGRKDLPDSSGYVSGYTNKNTYDKKNPK